MPCQTEKKEKKKKYQHINVKKEVEKIDIKLKSSGYGEIGIHARFRI